MKKYFIFLLAVILMLSGCGNATGSGIEKEMPAAEETVVLAEEQVTEESESKESTEAPEQPEETPEPKETPEPEESVAPETESPESAESSETEQADGGKPASTPATSTAQKPSTTATPSPASGQSQSPAPSSEPVHTCSWDGGTVTKAATCTSEGVMTYTCTSCGKTRTESIAKTDHNYAWLWAMHEDLGNCTERYRLVDICSNCGYILNTYTDEIISNHKLDEGVMTGGPSCIAPATFTQTCIKCGEVCVTQTIGPTGHQLESCGSGNCRICGAHVEHQWADGQCYCGAVQEE